MFTQQGTIVKHSTISNAILFQSPGYVSITNESYEDCRISFTFTTPANKVALVPKYMSDGNYLFVSLDKDKRLHVGGMVKGSEKIYGSVDATLYILPTNKLVVISNGSHFTVYLNDKALYKFESALFVNGTVRVAAEAGEVMFSCEVEEPQSTAWITNTTSGGLEAKVVEIEDHLYHKLIGSQTKKTTVSQSFSIASGTHILSFSAKGTGTCYVKAPDNSIIYQKAISAAELTRITGSFSNPVSQTISLLFETNSEVTIGKHQLEKRSDATTYIPNPNTDKSVTRKGSVLSYPVKDLFDKKTGSLYLKLSTGKYNLTTTQTLLRSDTNEFKLFITGGTTPLLSVSVGSVKVDKTITLLANTSYEILTTWSNEGVELTVNGENTILKTISDLSTTPQSLIFAEETSIKREFVLEEWALFNNKIPYVDDIKSHIPFAVMQSLFDGGISGQNVTWSEIPVAPIDHSPILVQKDNGETLQKVSFFDFETGEYQTHNKEPFVYDGKSDYVEVAYNNLDEKYRDIAIRTEDGEKIGEPYHIDGKRLYFTFYSSLKPTLKNKTLYATYQVNDTYTVDYNIKAVDGYRINFAKHDGGKRIVYQEGNRYGEQKKLATMIDMNPIQNQNHEGFVYVTATVNKTDSFRITATPDRLHADGSSFSTLIIEPLDYQGNFLSHANLQIVADKGFISRHISRDAVEAQKRSGQYLFQYYAPYIQSSKTGEIVEDYIWITDKDSNIGVCYKMILSPVKKASIAQLSRTEKTLLKNKSEIINYLLMYEGVEKYEDDVLFSILDLNQDGRVTMDEVLVLETNEKDQELTVILNKLRKWEATK